MWQRQRKGAQGVAVAARSPSAAIAKSLGQQVSCHGAEQLQRLSSRRAFSLRAASGLCCRGTNRPSSLQSSMPPRGTWRAGRLSARREAGRARPSSAGLRAESAGAIAAIATVALLLFMGWQGPAQADLEGPAQRPLGGAAFNERDFPNQLAQSSGPINWPNQLDRRRPTKAPMPGLRNPVGSW